MIKILLKCLLVLYLAITLSFAFPSPTDPYGATVWTKGQKVVIKWTENKSSPLTSTFTGITIQLMTGPDLEQISLVTVVDKLSKTETSYSWTAPSPKALGYPSGQIYFLMFSDSKNPSYGYSWTTRFTILEDQSATTIGYTGGPWTITGGSGSTPTATGNSTITSTSATSTDSTTSETTDTTETTETTDDTSTTEMSTSIEILTTEDPSPPQTTTTIPPANPIPDNPFSSSNRLNAIGSWSILIVMISMTLLI